MIKVICIALISCLTSSKVLRIKRLYRWKPRLSVPCMYCTLAQSCSCVEPSLVFATGPTSTHQRVTWSRLFRKLIGLLRIVVWHMRVSARLLDVTWLECGMYGSRWWWTIYFSTSWWQVREYETVGASENVRWRQEILFTGISGNGQSICCLNKNIFSWDLRGGTDGHVLSLDSKDSKEQKQLNKMCVGHKFKSNVTLGFLRSIGSYYQAALSISHSTAAILLYELSS